MSIEDERAELNASLRSGGRSAKAAQDAPSVPTAVTDATDRLRSAIAADDAEAVENADRQLEAAIKTAASGRRGHRRGSWGEGARGTGAGPRDEGMNERIRSAGMNPLDPARGTGSIR